MEKRDYFMSSSGSVSTLISMENSEKLNHYLSIILDKAIEEKETNITTAATVAILVSIMKLP